MKKTAYYSFANGSLPPGCQMCVQGRKLVLFVTGICSRACYFCPLSEQKFHTDVIYANERQISDFKEIIEEAKISGAHGCGITGGDPLAQFQRTIDIITMLKAEFQNFHIHLYTPLELVSEEKIQALEDAGLDEIRFHPDLDNTTLWEKIKIPTKMMKGIEIPCIPGKDIERLLRFVDGHVAFVNLNELEYADAKQNKLAEMGYVTKDDYSYGIAGSETLGMRMLHEFSNMRMHFCTAKLKDSIQMVNRLSLRAKNIRKPYDTVRGMCLLRGAIYGDESLELMKEKLALSFFVDIDFAKKRLLCSQKDLKKFRSKIRSLNYIPVLVEELASYDLLEIESQEI